MWEEGIGRGDPEAEAVVERQAQAPNAGEEFDPGKEEPSCHTTDSRHHGIKDVVEREVTGRQERQGPKLSCRVIAAAPEGHRQDDQTEYKEEFPHKKRA